LNYSLILVGRIWALAAAPWPVLVILCTLCFLIYAVMAIWPTYYLQEMSRLEGKPRDATAVGQFQGDETEPRP
jgi:hypothetical protein